MAIRCCQIRRFQPSCRHVTLIGKNNYCNGWIAFISYLCVCVEFSFRSILANWDILWSVELRREVNKSWLNILDLSTFPHASWSSSPAAYRLSPISVATRSKPASVIVTDHQLPPEKHSGYSQSDEKNIWKFVWQIYEKGLNRMLRQRSGKRQCSAVQLEYKTQLGIDSWMEILKLSLSEAC